MSEAPVFLLVHGAWHGAWCFSDLVIAMSRLGLVACPLEMPGHGLDARLPERISDVGDEQTPEARSAAADRDWHNGIAKLEEIVADIRAAHNGPLILLGHSAGGLTISALAERRPDLFDELVYLCAFLIMPGESMMSVYGRAENEGAEVADLLVESPMKLGVQRIDPRSPDASRRERIRHAFCADLDEKRAAAMLWHIIPDEPLGPDTLAMTEDRWGTVPRSYIVAERDRAIRADLQRWMAKEADMRFPARSTRMLNLDSDHSPFFTRTDDLAQMLLGIGKDCIRRRSGGE